MSHSKLLLSRSDTRGFHLGLQPAPAWIAILSLIFFSLLCILAGAASILRLVFPAGAFVVGVFLYRRYPLLYLGFTWWLWFLTPWVRRLIDYRSSFVDPSTVLLAPFLVTLVTLATFLRHFPKSYRQEGLPFVLALSGVVYSVLLGLVNSKFGLEGDILYVINAQSLTYTLNNVIVRTLDWATPILFGFHLLANWHHYPEYRQNIQRTFRWGVLVMGVYGIVQYLVAPEWDRFWMASLLKNGMFFGHPEPLGMRVFSTMNSPAPFAHAMLAGLLLLLADQGLLRFFSAGFGYLSFLLTLVRTAWGGWLLGFLIFSTSLKSKLQMRLIITVLVIGVCALPITTVEPFSTVINERVESFSNVQEDGSYQARSATYDRAFSVLPFQPVGNGLGLPGLDSAFLDVLVAMGWIGGIPFFGGLILLLFKLSQSLKRRFDPFLNAASAISLASVGMLVLNNVFTGAQGVILWSFLGIVVAGHKYYQHQRPERGSSY